MSCSRRRPGSSRTGPALVVLAWTWLQVLLAQAGRTDAASEGRARAARYFFHYELPKIPAWLKVVETRDLTCADTPEDAF